MVCFLITGICLLLEVSPCVKQNLELEFVDFCGTIAEEDWSILLIFVLKLGKGGLHVQVFSIGLFPLHQHKMEYPDTEENFFSALSSARYVGRLAYSVRFRTKEWKLDHVLSLIEGNGTLSDLSILTISTDDIYDWLEWWRKIQLAVSNSLNVATAEFDAFDSEILQSLHKNRSLKNIKLDCGKLPSLLSNRRMGNLCGIARKKFHVKTTC